MFRVEHPLVCLAHKILARFLAFDCLQLALHWSTDQHILGLELCVRVLGYLGVKAHGGCHHLYNIYDLDLGLGSIAAIA